jgi:hypothetical protein
MFGYGKVSVDGELREAVGKASLFVICPATGKKVA